MNELFKILGTIAVDSSGVDGDLDKAVGKADKSGGKFKSILQGIGMGIGNMMVQGAQKIASFAGDAMNASDALNKYTNTMKFAGFKDADINKSRNTFKKYADDTVYDLDTITNTGAQLAANGIKNFQSLTTSAGNLNAVAGGNADTFKSVAMVMTQTAGAGKLTTENWNQMADAIPGASGMLQKAMKDNGAYTGNFRDAMAQGQITSEEFNKAIEQLGSKPVAVEAAKSTSTFEGAIGNLEATATTGLMKVIDAFGKGGMTSAISGFGNGVEKAFDVAVTWIGKTKNFLKDLGSAINTEVDFSVLKDVFQDFGKTFDGLGKIAGNFFKSLTGGQTITAQNTIKTLAGIFGKVFTALVNGSADINRFIQSNLPAIQGFFDKIKGVIQAWWGAFSALWGRVSVLFTQVFGSMKTWWDANGAQLFQAISNIVSVVMQNLITYFNNVKAIVQAVWPAISGIIRGAVQVIQGILDIFIGVFTGNWSKAWEGIKSILSGVWTAIKGVVKAALNVVVAAFSGPLNTIKSTVSNAFNSVKSTISNVLNSTKNIVSNVISAIKGFFGGLRLKFPSIDTSMFTNAKNAIKNVVDSIKGFFSGLHLDLPKIKIPHINVSGGKAPFGIGGKGSLPSFNVDWYAKGGIMDGPTIFGMNGNSLQVGGEAGREAILPLNEKVLAGIGAGIHAASGKSDNGLVFNQYNYSPENLTPRESAKQARRAGKDMVQLLRRK